MHPGDEVASRWDDRDLILVVGDNLCEFLLDILGAFGFATEASQASGGGIKIILLDEVARGLGEKEQADSKDDCPKHLDGDWDAVRTCIVSVLGAIVDARSEQDTDSDTELVSRDNGPTDLPGCDLAHVKDDDCRNKTDTESSDKTSSNKETEASRGSLKDNTDGEDDTSEDDSNTTTEPIRAVLAKGRGLPSSVKN